MKEIAIHYCSLRLAVSFPYVTGFPCVINTGIVSYEPLLFFVLKDTQRGKLSTTILMIIIYKREKNIQ